MQSTEDFRGSENTLYYAMMMDPCHYTLPKPREGTPPTNRPSCKLWTWNDHDASAEVHQL